MVACAGSSLRGVRSLNITPLSALNNRNERHEHVLGHVSKVLCSGSNHVLTLRVQEVLGARGARAAPVRGCHTFHLVCNPARHAREKQVLVLVNMMTSPTLFIKRSWSVAAQEQRALVERQQEHRREVAQLQAAVATEASKAATVAAEAAAAARRELQELQEVSSVEVHDEVAALKAQLAAARDAAQQASVERQGQGQTLHQVRVRCTLPLQLLLLSSGMTSVRFNAMNLLLFTTGRSVCKASDAGRRLKFPLSRMHAPFGCHNNSKLRYRHLPWVLASTAMPSRCIWPRPLLYLRRRSENCASSSRKRRKLAARRQLRRLTSPRHRGWRRRWPACIGSSRTFVQRRRRCGRH